MKKALFGLVVISFMFLVISEVCAREKDCCITDDSSTLRSVVLRPLASGFGDSYTQIETEPRSIPGDIPGVQVRSDYDLISLTPKIKTKKDQQDSWAKNLGKDRTVTTEKGVERGIKGEKADASFAKKCFQDSACSFYYDSSGKATTKFSPHFLYSFTGRVVACVRDTLDMLFIDTGCAQELKILPALKNNLHGVILITLVLYVVLFGIEIVTRGEIPEKKELFTFILKIGFVLYFGVGNGLTEIVYEGGFAVMNTFSNYIMNVGTSKICNFPMSDYTGSMEKYSYVALWDAVDCRIAHYFLLGFSRYASGYLDFGVLSVIIPLIFSFEILIVFFMILYVIFVISIVAYFLHFFMIAMIGVALLTYLGVLFVPMILFSYTKQYFDEWKNAIIGFVLQPVVITAFIVLPFLVFDEMMYGSCDPDQVGGLPLWVVNVAGADSGCKETLGYNFAKMFQNDSLKSTSGFLFDYVTFSSGVPLAGLLTAILKMLFFCYLFLMLVENGGSLASKLCGGPNIGSYAVNAGAFLKEVANRVMQKPPDKNKGGKGGGGGSGSAKRSGIGASAAGKGGGGASSGISAIAKK